MPKKKLPIYCLIYFSLLLSCAQKPKTSTKLVFAFDSSESAASQLQAAKQAIEKFNAVTDINGHPIELQALDLTKQEIRSEQDLENYLQEKRQALLAGFVLGTSTGQRSQDLKKVLQDTSILYIDNSPSDNTKELPHINIQRPALEKNSYLAQFIQEQRPLQYLYVIYTQNYQQQAKNFADMMRSKDQNLSQNLRFLEYTIGEKSTDDRIRSIADFFRDERQDIEENSGIVFFFDQDRADLINSYLDRSPYRYLFDDLDFYLVGNNLAPEDLSDPNIKNYYVFQASNNQADEYQTFREQYQKKYHLKASYSNAEIFDAVCLLAYASKKVLESQKSNRDKEGAEIAPILFQSMTQMAYNGATGSISFDSKGKRRTDHELLKLETTGPRRIAHYVAAKGQFSFN